MTPPPMLVGAVACLIVAQIIGLIAWRMRLDFTGILCMMILLGAALTLGILGGLQFLPGRL